MKPIAALFSSRKFILLLVVVAIGFAGVFTHQPGMTFGTVFSWVAGGFGLLMATIAHEDAAAKSSGILDTPPDPKVGA